MLHYKNYLLFIIITALIQSCALDPLTWTPPIPKKSENSHQKNEHLSSTEWIHLNGWWGPEDIEFDSIGNMYTGVHTKRTDFSDGRILKIDTSGIISTFCNTGAWSGGMEFDKNGNLIVMDHKRGLISIDSSGKITTLASQDENGNPFLIPNDLDIASDGTIYFSNTSSKMIFNRKNARKIVLEQRPDGGLYRYDPTTQKVTTLIDSSFFGNGVAVAADDEFVLMVDLAKYRILRYWLKGEKSGSTDIFIDNLPGLPNGISRRKDGSFWLGFTTERDPLLDKIQPRRTIKKIIFSVPLWLQPKQKPFGMVMHLGANGKILNVYYDTTGKYVSEASSIEEYDGYLYMGGDLIDHIGKFKLPKK